MRRAALVLLSAGCRQLLGFEEPHVGVDDASVESTDPDAPPDVAIDAPAFVCAQDPALLACYAFDGDVIDGSTYGHDLTTANVTFGTGYHAGGLTVGATSSVTIGPVSTLAAAVFTIKAWVNPTMLPGVGQRAGIVDVENRYRMFVQEGGGLRCAFTRASSGTVDVIAAPGIIPLAMWTRIACTYDGAMLRVYVNGAVVATTLDVSPVATTLGSMAIGQNSPSGDNFVGTLDEIEVWRSVVAP